MSHLSHQAQRPSHTEDRPVYVVGGGPAGLAAAHELRARGVRAVVLERGARVGDSWRRHYDRLRLHTPRRRSALPGLNIPRSNGRWVARDDLVRYLERYADHHGLEVVTSVEVSRIERSADGEGWLLHATGGRELTGSAVVVATGYSHTPHLPDWAGREHFPGELLHAADYRNARHFQGRDVLVVGAGNTGAEVAVDLAEGGAARVRLAVRTAPHLLRRSVLGVPAHTALAVGRRLPAFLGDRLARPWARLTVPDLAEHGLPRPETGLFSRARQGALPVLDAGLIKAVRAGRVEPVAAVDSFDGDKVLLADGTRLAPEAVIAATGHRRGLEPLVGHLGVLDADGLPTVRTGRSPRTAPGLFFAGYTQPVTGALPQLALDARKIARTIARHS